MARMVKGKLDIEILLNATLAGAVSMGANADLITNPGGSIALGFLVGSLSSLGYAVFTPIAREKFGLHDTCGVLYLHCIPGILGGLISAIVSETAAGDDQFGNFYPEFVDGRSPRTQAGY